MENSYNQWQKPHQIKIYEALSTIADNRIESIEDNKNAIKVFSTSGNKYYSVEFNPATFQIMSNDNSAFYTDTLSYPMIVLLILKNIIKTDRTSFSILKHIKWKDVNQKYKNNYDQALASVLPQLKSINEIEFQELQTEVQNINQQIQQTDFFFLGKKQFPPQVY